MAEVTHMGKESFRPLGADSEITGWSGLWDFAGFGQLTGESVWHSGECPFCNAALRPTKTAYIRHLIERHPSMLPRSSVSHHTIV